MLNSYKNVEIKSTTESKKCVPPARFEPGTSWGQTFGILRGFTYITFYMVIQFVICYLHKIYGSLLISCIPLDLKSTLNIVFLLILMMQSVFGNIINCRVSRNGASRSHTCTNFGFSSCRYFDSQAIRNWNSKRAKIIMLQCFF